ncbi:MAG: ATP-binding protein [Gammaproteobacteria bacterium]|nr:ATP-binding protein [Gammaproteobacteria bacterium]
MSDKMVDITLHIDENTNHADRESLRDDLLHNVGVMAADYDEKTPHLMTIAYDPDKINSSRFVRIAENKGLHAELIGL